MKMISLCLLLALALAKNAKPADTDSDKFLTFVSANNRNYETVEEF